MVSRLCVPNLEYQFVNPTTQVSLFSQCLPLCTAINNITWTVYQGIMNASSNIVRWTPYPGMKQYESIWFYGNSSILMLMICMFFLLSDWIKAPTPATSLPPISCFCPIRRSTIGASKFSTSLPVRDEFKCFELHHQSAANEWLLFHCSTQRHYQHVVSRSSAPRLARSRWHQRLFDLQ